MKTLEQILKETAKAKNGGEFGITACKESIREDVAFKKGRMESYKGMSEMEILYILLYTYVRKTNESPFFNSNIYEGEPEEDIRDEIAKEIIAVLDNGEGTTLGEGDIIFVEIQEEDY